MQNEEMLYTVKKPRILGKLDEKYRHHGNDDVPESLRKAVELGLKNFSKNKKEVRYERR